MHKPVFILGAGGFARETLDIYFDCKLDSKVLGFVEENCRSVGCFLNGKPVYDVSYLKNFEGKDKPLMIGGIGSTKRKRLILELEKDMFEFDTIIHPSVISSKWVVIGEGCIITPGVIMTCQVDVGRHVILNLGVQLGHDVKVGDFSTLSPGAKIMGGSSLGDSVYVGVNATVIEHIHVGDGAVIAAGAVVVKDVPPMSLVAGVPAQIKKTYNSIDEKPW